MKKIARSSPPTPMASTDYCVIKCVIKGVSVICFGVTGRYASTTSRLTQKTLPNNIKQQMIYDNAGRLTSLIYKASNDTIIEQLDYEYDARGQRTSITTQGSYPVAHDVPIAASYNTANRLTTLTLRG